MSEDNKEVLREASHNCQVVVDIVRQEHLERFCAEKIGGPENSSKIWKKVSELRRRNRQPERPLLVYRQYTQGVQEKAEALTDVFSRASQSPHLPEEVARHRAEEESRFETPVMDNSTPMNDLSRPPLPTPSPPTPSPLGVAILSDSKSALQPLANGG